MNAGVLSQLFALIEAAMMTTLDPEILSGFLEEARCCLPAIRAGVDQLDQAAPRDEAMRLADCLKGAAALVELPGLSYLAGCLEEVLADVERGLLPSDDGVRMTLSKAVELIDTHLQRIGDSSFSEAILLQTTCLLFRRLRVEPEEGDQTALAEVLARLDARSGSAVSEEEALPMFDTAVEAPAGWDDSGRADDGREAVDPDLLEVFLQEAEGHLQSIRSLLPALESGDAGAVGTIRRSAHTLKGSAAMVGFRALTRLAHRMEDVLDRIFEGGPLTAETLDLLKASADGLEDLAAGQRNASVLQGLHVRYDRLLGGDEATSEVAVAGSLLTSVLVEPGHTGAETVRPSSQVAAEMFVRVPLHRLDELVRLVSDLTIARTTAEHHQSAHAQKIEGLVRLAERLQSDLGSVASLNNSAAHPPSPDGLREWEQLSSALEMSATISEVGALVEDLGSLSAVIEDGLQRQGRLVSDIHDRLMHIRLVPFATLAARLRRTVRQVAESSAKRIELTLEGETVALDKAVLEEMAEPLMHLLRNAVDHGIESPDQRRQRGKDEVGRIFVRASHEGNQIVLSVVDDGDGVDLEAVRVRALERGLASPEAADRLTEAELLAIPFQPGFSTARAISETSGRGVGLDIVRTSVERLNGSITLTSRPGVGTTFLVRLPMSVAILRALLVKAGGQTFALPLAAVVRIVRLSAQPGEARDGQIQIGEELYPRVALGEVLRLRASPTADGERPSVVLIETGDGRVALTVDQVQGGQEIVVKSLGAHLRNVRGLSGATLTSDGSVVLILNPAQLAAPSALLANARPDQSARQASRPLSVLVVDDSPSVRRILTGLIRSVGWTVLTAGDGLEALDLLSKGAAPDVLLVDVDMPRMDGFAFLSAVKSQESLRGVPVVMVTSRSGASHRRKASELGADGYVVKPYQNEDLLTTIRRLTDA